MVENPFQSPSSSIDSEKYEKRISSSSSSMIRSSDRKSAERGRFWSTFRFRRVGIGSMMILAIFVLSLVFALGKCGPLERKHRRETKITLTGVSRLEFFDADDVQRGAATLGGRIKMKLSDLKCPSGPISLVDVGGGKFLGEVICGSDTPPFEFNVTDLLTLGQFKIKTNETESRLFDTYIYYILVNRPINAAECKSGEVYAKVAGGTKCTTTQAWCARHHFVSSKFGCPAPNDDSVNDMKSYCYGVGTEDRKPTSETDNVNKCKGKDPLLNPYISYDRPSVPNDGLIKMTKGDRTIIVKVPARSTGKFEYKIDYLNGSKPFDGNETPFIAPAKDQGRHDFNVSLELFDEPFKAVLEVKTTFDDGHEFITRCDLIYLETDMEVKITAECILKTGTCTHYEATGKLAAFCKRTKNVICGMKIGNQIHKNIVVPNVKMENGEAPKAIFFFGWYPWSGQEFVNKTFAETEPGVTFVTEATTTDGGGGHTDDQRISNSTPPIVAPTRPIPNSTSSKIDDGAPAKPADTFELWKIWTIAGCLAALLIIGIVVGIFVGIWWFKKSKSKPKPKGKGPKDDPYDTIADAHELTSECKKARAVVEKNASQPKQSEFACPDELKVEKAFNVAKDLRAPKIARLENPCLATGQVDNLNANVMEDSYGLPQVISQGPTPEEMFSFWSNLMELKTGVLVVNGEIFDEKWYDKTKINAAFPIELLKTFIFENKTTSETIKVSTISKTNLLEGIIMRRITVVKEGKGGKMDEITITALQMPEFTDKKFDLKEEEVRTLAMFVVKVFEEQMERAAKGLPGVWIHCRAGLERSAIVAALHQSFQIIVKLGHVNVRAVMRYIRSKRLGTFSDNEEPYGITTIGNRQHMIDLIENRAIPMLVKWRKEGKTFDDLCTENASAEGKKRAAERKTMAAANLESPYRVMEKLTISDKDSPASSSKMGKSIASASQIGKSSASNSKIGKSMASTSKVGKSSASVSQNQKSTAAPKKM